MSDGKNRFVYDDDDQLEFIAPPPDNSEVADLNEHNDPANRTEVSLGGFRLTVDADGIAHLHTPSGGEVHIHAGK